MIADQTLQPEPRPQMGTEFDAIVIGAGVAGLYQLYRLRELGLSSVQRFADVDQEARSMR